MKNFHLHQLMQNFIKKLFLTFFMNKAKFYIAVFLCCCTVFVVSLYDKNQEQVVQSKSRRYYLDSFHCHLNKARLAPCKYVSDKYFPSFKIYEYKHYGPQGISDLCLEIDPDASDTQIILYLAMCSLVSTLPFELEKTPHFDNLVTWIYEYLSYADFSMQPYDVRKEENGAEITYYFFPIESPGGQIQPLIQYETGFEKTHSNRPELLSEVLDIVRVLDVNSINEGKPQFREVAITRNRFWMQVRQFLRGVKSGMIEIERDIYYLKTAYETEISPEVFLMLSGGWLRTGIHHTCPHAGCSKKL